MGKKMHYNHIVESKFVDLPVGKVVCVGRNYVAHAKELSNPVPKSPIFFMKPSTAIIPFTDIINLSHINETIHYETEVSLLIGSVIDRHSSEKTLIDAVVAVGLGLDLTLRDVQSKLKENGHPWERAKAFDYSCPLAPFLSKEKFIDLQNISFSFEINEVTVQEGNTKNMIFSVHELLKNMVQQFTLLPGDVVLTGTPEGVGKLQNGDRIGLKLGNYQSWKTQYMQISNMS